MYVTGVTVTGVIFLMDNTSEDQYIRSYVCTDTVLIHTDKKKKSIA